MGLPAAAAAQEEGRGPDFTIVPRGPFSLQEAVEFGFGQRDAERFDGVMRLAFCVDGYREHAAVALRQDDAGVHGWVEGGGDLAVVRAQVARVLSLDHDAEPYLQVGERDPVVARLQAAAPGLRPPLFHSPYEAAAWAVLSARRPAPQMADMRRRLSEQHGRVFSVACRPLAAFPTPDRLLAVDAVPGLPEVKLRRMHGIAAAALEGRLDGAALRATAPPAASAQLCELDGIGPFYSSLVLVRATGHADLLPEQEPKLRALVGELYGLGAPADAAQLRSLAEAWRPFRTWVAVLVRAAAGRV